MEDEYIVEISMPLENRKKLQEQYNNTFNQFKNFLQSNYGTSNVNHATAIATAILTAQIAINIATLGTGVGKLLKPFPELPIGVTPEVLGQAYRAAEVEMWKYKSLVPPERWDEYVRMAKWVRRLSGGR